MTMLSHQSLRTGSRASKAEAEESVRESLSQIANTVNSIEGLSGITGRRPLRKMAGPPITIKPSTLTSVKPPNLPIKPTAMKPNPMIQPTMEVPKENQPYGVSAAPKFVKPVGGYVPSAMNNEPRFKRGSVGARPAPADPFAKFDADPEPYTIPKIPSNAGSLNPSNGYNMNSQQR